ncbi:hypothetical protein SAMN05445850_8574 [Paraburkholderia tuberum]|uniref:Uncharacterized protein n=1 Tax=Paraburkholderia tuberum TaxID=157910 RepID=A0A1H1KLV7_9BURK|nr:hypothetical protein SAMN05445850_8574 [Paraburkholderia tuberum]
MPQGADDLPLNANGPAYTSQQDRHGVPLSYVGEKLGRAIGDLHRHAQCCQGDAMICEAPCTTFWSRTWDFIICWARRTTIP